PDAAFTPVTLPSSTFSPRAMMHTESHIFSALSMMCVLNTTVLPRRFSSRMASFSACALIGSRPLNGSSRMTRSGSCSSVAMNCTFCCMPRDSSSTLASPLFFPRRREPDRLDLFAAAGRARPRAPPFALGEKQQAPPHLHLLIETALLGQIADLIQHLAIGVRPAEERDGSRIGKDDVEHHSDRRRLAGAIGAEQAVHRPTRYLKRQCAHGDVLLVPLHDIAN